MASSLVAAPAYDFSAPAVVNGQLCPVYNYFSETDGRYSVLFFYPLNFTFVCPSELIALEKQMDDFLSRQVDVITLSVDSHHSHMQWQQSPAPQGIGPVRFNMVSDLGQHIAKSYGACHPREQIALRSVIIVDKKKCVRAQLTYDLGIGRSIGEILRIIDACQQMDASNGAVCPVNWTKDQNTMQPSKAGVEEYFAAQ